MTGDQLAVAGHDEVRLDIVGALQNGQRVRGKGVLGHVATGAAVGNDQRMGLVAAVLGSDRGVGRGGKRGDRQQQAAGGKQVAQGRAAVAGHCGRLRGRGAVSLKRDNDDSLTLW